MLKHYKALKAANPTLPVLIRECAGVEPRLTARFGALAFCRTASCVLPRAPLTPGVSMRAAAGREEAVSLAGLAEGDVGAKLDTLLKKA